MLFLLLLQTKLFLRYYWYLILIINLKHSTTFKEDASFDKNSKKEGNKMFAFESKKIKK